MASAKRLIDVRPASRLEVRVHMVTAAASSTAGDRTAGPELSEHQRSQERDAACRRVDGTAQQHVTPQRRQRRGPRGARRKRGI